MEQNFDLFGEPIPEGRGKRGRPAHVVTVEKRNKVNILLACGWSNQRIAGALGLSLPTFRKNYFHELKSRDAARDKLDAQRMSKLWDLAVAGNVGAFKEFARLLEKNDAALIDRSFREVDKTEASEARRMGKKEIAQMEADEVAGGADGDWGGDLAFRVMN